jgi:hypothetical protein
VVARWHEGGEMEDESPLSGHACTGKDHPMWGGGHRRRTVTVACTRERPVRPIMRHRPLTSGHQLHFIISMIFNHLNFEI